MTLKINNQQRESHVCGDRLYLLVHTSVDECAIHTNDFMYVCVGKQKKPILLVIFHPEEKRCVNRTFRVGKIRGVTKSHVSVTKRI